VLIILWNARPEGSIEQERVIDSFFATSHCHLRVIAMNDTLHPHLQEELPNYSNQAFGCATLLFCCVPQLNVIPLTPVFPSMSTDCANAHS
jgi:hypothetical protein